MLAVELSLGLNGALYRWLYDHLFAFRGFRAPARFAILACCAMSVLAGFGYHGPFSACWPAGPARRFAADARCWSPSASKSGSSPLAARGAADEVPPVYRFLQTLRADGDHRVSGEDYNPTYMFWSTYHWHSLINGYSGYTPQR